MREKVISAVCISIIGFSLAFRLIIFPQTLLFDGDEYNHAFGAEQIGAGVWPYDGMFEHKPVGVYYPHVVAQALFGSTTFAIRALGLFLVVTTALIFASLARKFFTSSGKLTVLVLPGLYLALSLTCEGLETKSELSVNFLIVCLFFCLAHGLNNTRGNIAQYCAAGAFAGIASQVNYLSVPISSCIFGGFFWARLTGRCSKDQYKEVILALVFGLTAATIAAGLVLLPLLMDGNLQHYLHLQRVFLNVYGARENSHSLIGNVLRMINPLVIFILAGAGIGVLALPCETRSEASGIWKMSLLALVGAGISTCVSGRFSPNYMLLTIPPLLMFIFSSISRVIESEFTLEKSLTITCVLYFLLVSAASAIVSPFMQWGPLAWRSVENYYRGISNHDIADVAKYTKSIEGDDHFIFVYAEFKYAMSIYYLVGANAPSLLTSPLYYTDPMISAAFSTSPAKELSALLAKRPKVVVVGQGDAGPKPQAGERPSVLDTLLDASLKDDYQLRKTFHLGQDAGGSDLSIYVRNDSWGHAEFAKPLSSH